MRLIEKVQPSHARYIIEFSEEELKTIWSDVGNAAFSCEQTYENSPMAHNENMKQRIKFERDLQYALYEILYGVKLRND